MNNKVPDKHVVKLVYVAWGRDAAFDVGIKLGKTPGTLRTWFSRWRTR